MGTAARPGAGPSSGESEGPGPAGHGARSGAAVATSQLTGDAAHPRLAGPRRGRERGAGTGLDGRPLGAMRGRCPDAAGIASTGSRGAPGPGSRPPLVPVHGAKAPPREQMLTLLITAHSSHSISSKIARSRCPEPHAGDAAAGGGAGAASAPRTLSGHRKRWEPHCQIRQLHGEQNGEATGGGAAASNLGE